MEEEIAAKAAEIAEIRADFSLKNITVIRG